MTDLSAERVEAVRDRLDRIRWLVEFVDRMGERNWSKAELSIVLLNLRIFAEQGLLATGVDDLQARAKQTDMTLALDEDMADLAENLQPSGSTSC